jgi:MFS family permease
VWGRLLGRYGNKSVVAVSLFLWQTQNYLWCILTPGNRNLVYFMWIWGGVFNAGFVLGQFTLFLKLIPARARNLSIGINLALISVVAAVAPIVGGAALDWALLRWPDHALDVYHACFLVQPTVALIGTAVLLRIHEPQAGSFTSVLSAVGRIRTLGDFLGLSTLVDYVFYRPRKP